MKPTNNFVTVDAPRIPVLQTSFFEGNEHGKMVEAFNGQYKHPEGILKGFDIQDMYMPHFSLRLFKGSLDYNAVFTNEKAEGKDLLGACFFFQGNVNTHLEGSSNFTKLTSGFQSLKFDPHCEYHHWCTAHDFLHFAQLSITNEYFLEILPDNDKSLDTLRNKVLKGEGFIAENPMRISMEQNIAFENVINCSINGHIRHLLIESYMLQIFLIMLNKLFVEAATSCKQKLSSKDRDIIYAAKEHLDKTFLQDHSLTTLSRQFGININKLTLGFKHIFDASVFQYLLNLRMEHARKLLQCEGLFVNEVSTIVGYKNIQHFTTAFRKHFGITPSSIKAHK